MSETGQPRVNQGTPDIRGAVRNLIVVQGLRVSDDIAVALDLRHALVVRVLERFEAVGALRITSETLRSQQRMIDAHSLSARFRDLNVPVW